MCDIGWQHFNPMSVLRWWLGRPIESMTFDAVDKWWLPSRCHTVSTALQRPFLGDKPTIKESRKNWTLSGNRASLFRPS